MHIITMTKQDTVGTIGAVPDDSSGAGAPDSITPAMIKAGVNILWELGGEVSKEALANAVYQAMESQRFSDRDQLDQAR